MKEEIWNELYLYLIWIEIGVFKNFKECARSPCNENHFSSSTSTSAGVDPEILNGDTSTSESGFLRSML